MFDKRRGFHAVRPVQAPDRHFIILNSRYCFTTTFHKAAPAQVHAGAADGLFNSIGSRVGTRAIPLAAVQSG